MRISLIAIGVLLAASAFATTYKWVDKNGVTHYSDTPAPGAEVVNLQSAQTFEATTPGTATSSRTSTAPGAEVPAYTKLDLWKPENEETYTNTGNVVTARVRIEPDLRRSHTIWLYLDGKRVDGLPGAGDSFTLQNVFRGTHTLAAVVTDQQGKQLISSQTVTFYMHQASTQAPNRPRPTPH
ncbi:MAG TPA: DUF4124 domain-containing protein [Steroidobacteraceae bacterium]|nr:DUF4124 domain-containing protein [Steroidobacteraceae bacterium]